MLNWCNKKKQSISHGAVNVIPCCSVGSRRRFNFHLPTVPRKFADRLAMSGFAPTFVRVLSKCTLILLLTVRGQPWPASYVYVGHGPCGCGLNPSPWGSPYASSALQDIPASLICCCRRRLSHTIVFSILVFGF